MNYMGDNSPSVENAVRSQQNADDASESFRRRSLETGRWPRRYVIAILLCILLAIQVARKLNTDFTFWLSVFAMYPSVGSWTWKDVRKFTYFMQIGDIFAAIVGALIIYVVSSRKFILVSVTISSILHMLMPVRLVNHSMPLLLIVRIAQDVLLIPTFIATLSMWKDWAPPEERMRLVTISLCALILQDPSGLAYLLFYSDVLKNVNHFYIGVAGIIWVSFWYSITADTPQNDPLISEKEYFYLESRIPANIWQEKRELKSVPWMSILKCGQIYILCVVFYKLSCSVFTIQVLGHDLISQYSLGYGVSFNPKAMFLAFVCVLAAILIGVSVTMDILIKRYKTYNLKIRKYFVCGGFVLQSISIFGALFSGPANDKLIFLILAYTVFGFSVPACITYPLDLSPRYVPIIAGIALAFFCLGSVSMQYIVEKTYQTKLNELSSIYLIDSIVSLITAILFGLWSDVEEKQWCQALPSRHRIRIRSTYPESVVTTA